MIETDLLILEKTKIEEIIGKYIELKARGVNYIGLCPFHYEKIPSFTISPTKQIFKCFGCGKSGNSISFISEFKKISHDKALEDIAATYNIMIPTSAIDIKDSYDEESIISKVSKPILDSFTSHIESVKSLMFFDKILLDFCITQIEGLNNRIKDNEEINITNIRYLPEVTLTQLTTIKQNDSFRIQFESIYNQCIVLIVSYFTSSVRDLFRESIQYYAEKKHECLKCINAELKFSFEELEYYDFDLSESIGDIIIKKKNLTFQDMQSICREFQTYFGIKIEKDSIVDNVILAQASRHAIIHSLSIADEKFINQISQTTARTIKPSISLNDELKFSPSEIEELMKNMREFLINIERKLLIK